MTFEWKSTKELASLFILAPLPLGEEAKRKAHEKQREESARAVYRHGRAMTNITMLRAWCVKKRESGCPQPSQSLSDLYTFVCKEESKQENLILTAFKRDYLAYLDLLHDSAPVKVFVARMCDGKRADFGTCFRAYVTLDNVQTNPLWQRFDRRDEVFLPGLGIAARPVMYDATSFVAEHSKQLSLIEEMLTVGRQISLQNIIDINRVHLLNLLPVVVDPLTMIKSMRSVLVRFPLVLLEVQEDWKKMDAAIAKEVLYQRSHPGEKCSESWPVDLHMAGTGYAAVVRARLDEAKRAQSAESKLFEKRHREYVSELLDKRILCMMEDAMINVRRIAYMIQKLACFTLRRPEVIGDLESIYFQCSKEYEHQPSPALHFGPEYSRATAQLVLWQTMLQRLQRVVDGRARAEEKQWEAVDLASLLDTARHEVLAWNVTQEIRYSEYISDSLASRKVLNTWYEKLALLRDDWQHTLGAGRTRLIDQAQASLKALRANELAYLSNTMAPVEQMRCFSAWLAKCKDDVFRESQVGSPVWHRSRRELQKVLEQRMERSWSLAQWNRAVLDTRLVEEAGMFHEHINEILDQAVRRYSHLQ